MVATITVSAGKIEMDSCMPRFESGKAIIADLSIDTRL